MIDFNNKGFIKLKGESVANGERVVGELLISGEAVIGSYVSMLFRRDFGNFRFGCRA